MRGMISKALTASLATLTIAAALLPAGEAAAAPFRDNWDNGWWFGWQGRAGGAYGYRGGEWWGPTVVVQAPYVYSGACTTTYQPIYDAYGDYIGQQVVNIC
jgi:hypothetical protein